MNADSPKWKRDDLLRELDAIADPKAYEDAVERMAAAIHRTCLLEWDGIAVVDPTRLLTMHMPDAHYGMAHDLVRRYGLPAAEAEQGQPLVRAAIEALPVHEITGAEWDCWTADTGCHYHWRRDGVCPYGHLATVEATYDRDGIRCEHDRLIDRDRVLALLP